MDHNTSGFGLSSAQLVYAVNPQGEVVHIRDVKKGAACDCRCPAPDCGARLIARQGEQLAWHFAHAANLSCSSGPETALHLLAKQIVQRATCLVLPRVEARHREQIRVLHEEREVQFDSVQPEFREFAGAEGVVPDLLARIRDRTLFVEFAVTHRCDPYKVAKLRARRRTTVEIDLSGIARDAPPDFVENQVLRSAPREWLFHREIEAAIAEMRAAQEHEKRVTEQRLAAQVGALLNAYQEAERAPRRRLRVANEDSDELSRVGLLKHVGIPTGGDGCFVCSPQDWQTVVLRDFVVARGIVNSPWRLGDVLRRLKELGAIRQQFRFISPDVERALETEGVLSPYRALEVYVTRLKEAGLVLDTGRGLITKRSVTEEIEARRERDLRRSEMTPIVRKRVTSLLASLPREEQDGFSLEEWLKDPQPSLGSSVSEAIAAGEASYQNMSGALRRIERIVFENGPPVNELLGLPLLGAKERAREARQKEQERRRHEQQQEADAGRTERLYQLTMAAHSRLGDGTAWLSSPNERLGKRTPLELAAESQEMLGEATYALHVEVQTREQERQKQIRAEGYRTRLRKQAERTLGPERARAFLRSPYSQLGLRRPEDHCVDEVTLSQCLELLKLVTKRELPRGPLFG